MSATFDSSTGFAAIGVRGADFEPDEEAKQSNRNRLLKRLREAGPSGLTRLEVPQWLALSMPARISELRQAGYSIVRKWERRGRSKIARYVLVAEPTAAVSHVQ